MAGDFIKTQQALDELKSLVFDFFQEYQLNVDVEDLADNLYEYFDQMFSVELEDESHVHVAQLLKHHFELLMKDQMQGLLELRQLFTTAVAIEQQQSMVEESSKKEEIIPLVDDDGFTLVQRKKR
jgi:hypothetical protein